MVKRMYALPGFEQDDSSGHLVWASHESLLVAGGIAGNFAGFSAAAILSIVEMPTAAVTLPPWCFSSNEVCVHLEFLAMHLSS